MSTVDEIAPEYVGEKRIKLTLSPTTPSPRAFQLVVIDVDYSEALPEGIVLPLVQSITGPTHTNREEHVHRRQAPITLTFRPVEGGSHSIHLGELFHNRWFGSLRIDVQGDTARGQ